MRTRWLALFLLSLLASPVFADNPYGPLQERSATGFRTSGGHHWLWSTIGNYLIHRQYTLPESQSIYSARQEFEVNRLSLEPRLTLDVDMNIEDDDRDIPLQDGPFHNGQVSLGFNVPILNPSAHYGIKTSESQIELAVRQADSLLQSEAMDQLRKLTELAAINEQLHIRNQYVTNLEDSAQLADATIEAGFSTRIAMNELRLALSKARRMREDTRLDQSLLIEELRTTLGDEMNIDESLSLDELQSSLGIDPTYDFCDGVSNSVGLAKQQLDVARRSLSQIQSEAQPSVDFFSTVSRRYSDADPTNKYVNSVSAGIRFTWNLGMGLQNQELELNARQRIYHAEEAVSRYRKLAETQCWSAYRRYADIQASQALVSEEVTASLRFVNYTRQRFEIAGLQTVPIQQLVNAEARLYEARENSLASRKQLVLSQWRLGSALGLIGVKNATLFIMD